MKLAVIPARFASTRFPGKPLAMLSGQTMIERVWRATAEANGVDRVIIATEDERVANEAKRIGAEYCITDSNINSGTDRCFAVVQQLQLTPEVVINVQGDEPLLRAETISDLVAALTESSADVTTPVRRITELELVHDANSVKVACTKTMQALYFSRSAIPYVRDAAVNNWLEAVPFWKHVGIYCMRMEALDRHVRLPQSPLELSEQLEQLRLLEDGGKFVCVPMGYDMISVDVPADADRVNAVLASLITASLSEPA